MKRYPRPLQLVEDDREGFWVHDPSGSGDTPICYPGTDRPIFPSDHNFKLVQREELRNVDLSTYTVILGWDQDRMAVHIYVRTSVVSELFPEADVRLV